MTKGAARQSGAAGHTQQPQWRPPSTAATILERMTAATACCTCQNSCYFFCCTAAMQQAGAEVGLLAALLRSRCPRRLPVPTGAATQHQVGGRRRAPLPAGAATHHKDAIARGGLRLPPVLQRSKKKEGRRRPPLDVGVATPHEEGGRRWSHTPSVL